MTLTRTLVLVLAGGSLAFPAVAEDNYPDLRGTWTGNVTAVYVDEGEPDAKPTFGTYTASFTISEQQDRRFAGHYAFQQGESKAIVGVFTEPNRIMWSEPGGFAHGSVSGDDLIEVCYLRSTEFEQIASCEQYERKK